VTSLAVDPDLPRCWWSRAAAERPDPLMVRYHDEEWGTPCHDDVELFERLALESFQAGLSWSTILHKRETFRIAFRGFVPAVVAGFGEADRARLMADAGIVRNRAKIEATVDNARRVLDLDRPLDALLWSFAPVTHPRPATLADVPATSPESVAMAKELKRRGLRFVGPTTCYALMQAAGLVDDHVRDCWRATAVSV
jgi:DNA-3-methyladenine glycosylase I